MRTLTMALACLIATSVSAEELDCSNLDQVRKTFVEYEQSVQKLERASGTESDCEGFGEFSDLACEKSENTNLYAEALRENLELQRQKLQYWERLCAGRGY